MRRYQFAALLVLAMSIYSHAQAIPAATARLSQAQVGVGFSFSVPDYGQAYLKGFSAYGDVDLVHRLGVEADVHYVSVFTPTDIGQDTFLIGPRYSLVRQGRLNAYVKALGGLGRFEYQSGYYRNPHTDSFGVFAIGGGIDFRTARHINIRAIDIEAQRWPGYGRPGYASHGLTPFVTTFGIAYVR